MRIFVQKEDRNPFTGLKAKSQCDSQCVWLNAEAPGLCNSARYLLQPIFRFGLKTEYKATVEVK